MVEALPVNDQPMVDETEQQNAEATSAAAPSQVLYAWARNTNGALGVVEQASADHFMLPTPIRKVRKPKSVSMFGNSYCSVVANGDVYSWGRNNRKQLGHNADKDLVTVPTKVPGLRQITSVAVGNWHSLALDSSGKAFSCGSNKNGELGRQGDGQVFAQVATDAVIEKIFAGFGVSYFIIGGKAHSCGKDNLAVQSSSSAEIKAMAAGLQNLDVAQIDCGMNYACLVTTDGQLYSWGDNTFQQTGTGSSKKNLAKPTLVSFFANNGLQVTQVSCSKGEKHNHTLCLTADGAAYAFGDPYKGQLGTIPVGQEWNHDFRGFEATPVKVIMPEGSALVTKVVCGGIHSAILTQDGKLYTWGCGSDGRLGHPEYEGYVFLYKESRPKLVETLANKQVVDVSSSYYAMMAITAD